MKKIQLILFSIIVSNIVLAQNDTISLLPFTPKITQQEGGSCWAYASAYVAVSTRVAYLNKTPNPSVKQVYSYGIIFNAMDIVSWGEVRHWSNTTFPGCDSDIGGLDIALYSLITYGTIPYEEFPNAKHIGKPAKQKLDAIYAAAKKVIKIKDVKEIITTCTFRDRNNSIQKIKDALLEGKTVICDIGQSETVCNEDFIEKNDNGMPPKDNHIVNIIGFCSSAKKFLIKNNYGDDHDCTFWVDCDKFLSVTSWAYTLDVIIK